MKIIGSIWSTLANGRVIGLVWGEDEHTRERKCYVGVLEFTTTEPIDALYITRNGAKIDVETPARFMAAGAAC